MRSHLYKVLFNEFCRNYQLVVQELLDVKDERPVLIDAVGNISVLFGHLLFNTPKNLKVILDCAFGFAIQSLLDIFHVPWPALLIYVF